MTRCAMKVSFTPTRLKAAGVPIAMSRYNGVNHGFMFWVGIVEKADAAMSEACAWLRRIFAAAQ